MLNERSAPRYHLIFIVENCAFIIITVNRFVIQILFKTQSIILIQFVKNWIITTIIIKVFRDLTDLSVCRQIIVPDGLWSDFENLFLNREHIVQCYDKHAIVFFVKDDVFLIWQFRLLNKFRFWQSDSIWIKKWHWTLISKYPYRSGVNYVATKLINFLILRGYRLPVYYKYSRLIPDVIILIWP